MKHVLRSFIRPLLILALVVLPLASARAQTQLQAPENEASAEAPAAGGKRVDRAIQRIRTEDAGSRIDELRVGGETQQITVQPKANLPAYEVKPAEGARGTAPAAASGDTNGSRVWNVLKF